jgi:DNA-directed RNA polymerase specialized sigma24 family protein
VEQFVSWLLTWLGGNLAELSQREDYEAVRRAAAKRLKVLPTVLCFIDDAGYTADAVRALLEHHTTTISNARIGSPEKEAWVDINRAAEGLPPIQHLALKLLAAGYSVTEIGRALDVNGSRLIMAACRQIATTLEAE